MAFSQQDYFDAIERKILDGWRSDVGDQFLKSIKSSITNPPMDTGIKASNFKWDGTVGRIDREKFKKLFGSIYECIEIVSDTTGKKMIFQDQYQVGTYVSKENRLIRIEVMDIAFPLKNTSDIQGKRIVITGTLSAERTDIQRRINSVGGIAQNQVNSQTDYLVIGDKPGKTKIDAAKLASVKILDGTKFMAYLNSIAL